jgi:hypothetical protein
MALAKHDPDWRWQLTLAGADTLADDLGVEVSEAVPVLAETAR